MYFLLIGIHFVFLGLCYFFGYYIFGWVFFLLFLFFLLYFSPLFFLRKDGNSDVFHLPKFSPQDSLFLPISFFYIALFLLLFALIGNFDATFRMYLFVFLGIYGIIFSYMIGFSWKNSVFFDITKMHTILSYITLIFLLSITFFSGTPLSFGYFLLFLVSLGYSFFYFSSTASYTLSFFLGFLTLLLIAPYSIFFFFSGVHSYPLLLSSIGFFWAITFEWIPRYHFFDKYLKEARIFTLFVTLFVFLLMTFWSIALPVLFAPILFLLIFLFAVHVRFCNYPVFFVAIFGLLFLYANIFFPLFLSGSLVSVLLFVFLLPLCIIVNTYFWDEKYPHDMKVLHSMSIAFSVLFSLYSLIFLPWGDMLLFVLSFTIFGIGSLLFLSYFRFRYR